MFDLSGPNFLVLYGGLLAGASVVVWVMRSRAREPDGDPDMGAMKKLTPIEIAFLAGGELQAARAAVASLVQRKLVTVDADTRTIRALSANLATDDAFERHVHRTIGKLGMTINELSESLKTYGEPVRRALAGLGWMVDDEQRARAESTIVAMFGGLLVLGVLRLAVGMARERPVGFLAVLLFITASGMMYGLDSNPRLSRMGERALESLRIRNAALRDTAITRADRIAPTDLALAVGLFGVSVLTSGPHADLGKAIASRAQKQAAGSSCSSCGAGCGGGSGSCGGGCGGCGGD